MPEYRETQYACDRCAGLVDVSDASWDKPQYRYVVWLNAVTEVGEGHGISGHGSHYTLCDACFNAVAVALHGPADVAAASAPPEQPEATP